MLFEQIPACLEFFGFPGTTADVLREPRAWRAHVHLADTGRLDPGAGGYDYPAFSGRLKHQAAADTAARNPSE